MATYSTTVAPDNTTLTTFKAWAMAISAAFSTFTWIQSGDTGQVVWTASVFTGTITSCTTSGGFSTYAYSGLTSGPIPRVGMGFTITGMGNGSNNIAAAGAVVSSVVAGVSFTVIATTQSAGTNEAGATGTATTVALAARPNAGAFVYEIWQTSDSVGFPVSVKFEYGAASGNIAIPAIFVTMGTGSNGSGSLNNPSTRSGMANPPNSSVTPFACHFSGDGGRINMLLFHGQGTVVNIYYFSFERSYDNTGTPTGTYYTQITDSQGQASLHTQQHLFPTGAVTVQETSGWAVVVPKTATSGNIGSTTHVSPVFPLVGGLGNPLIAQLVFVSTNFADNQVVYASIYGVQHTYISLGENAGVLVPQNVACGFLSRYD